MNTRQVSAYDIAALHKIRANVTRFIREQAQRLDAPGLTLLDVAPQDHAGAREFFRQAQVRTADIDPGSGADYILDICCNNGDQVSAGSFGVVLCTEVLEHTLNPFAAVAEMHRMLKPGGLLLLTTPFNFRIHGPLPDCWRFTEHGLRALLTAFDIEQLDALEDEDRFLMPVQYTTVARKR